MAIGRHGHQRQWGQPSWEGHPNDVSDLEVKVIGKSKEAQKTCDDLLNGVRITQKMSSVRSWQVKLKQTRPIWKLPSRIRHRSQGCRWLPMKKIKEMMTCEVVWRITASSSLVPFPCFSCWVKMCACCHCGVEVLNNFVGLSHGSSLHCNWNAYVIVCEYQLESLMIPYSWCMFWPQMCIQCHAGVEQFY